MNIFILMIIKIGFYQNNLSLTLKLISFYKEEWSCVKIILIFNNFTSIINQSGRL